MVPTLMKFSVLLLLFADEGHDCMLAPSELVSVHGLHIPNSVLRRLSLRQVHSLAGSYMHVAQIGTFVQFALATRKWSGDQW